MPLDQDVNSPKKWEADYQRGTDGWDLNGPTPVFKRLAASGQFKPGRMFVPGAGRGHDAREFARHGFQVTAVDFSPYAVREMRRLAEPAAPVEILESDLFKLPARLEHSFDYVLEYTCFCAIDPQRRDEYADLVVRLLRSPDDLSGRSPDPASGKPGGIYIDLAFPLDTHEGGPPFAVSVSEISALFEIRGFSLLQREIPADSVPQRRELEELLVFEFSNEKS